MKNNESNIRNNLIVFITLLSILVVAVLYVLYQSEKKSICISKEKNLKMVADYKISHISRWYADEVLDIGFISKDQALLEMVQKYVINPSNKYLVRYLYQIKTEHDYSDVLLLNQNGSVYVSASGVIESLDSVEVNELRMAVEGRKCLNTDFFKSAYDHKVYIDFICSFTDDHGRYLASLICRKSLEKDINPLIDLPISEINSETYLVKKKSDSKISIYQVNKNTATGNEGWFTASEKDEPTLKAATGYVGILYGKNKEGVAVCSYVSPIPETPWYFVVKTDKVELFKELHIKITYIFIIAFLLILICSIGLYIIYRHRREKDMIKLLVKEIELRQYQERYKATMDILGEGVIIADLSGNIQYLNLSAEALTGWKTEEATGKKLKDVFKIKHEQTDQFEYEMVNILSNNKIIYQIRKEILISRNGKEIPVGCILTPMKTGDSELSGIIISFQNETEVRRQEELLIKSEAVYKTMFENNPHPMWVYDKETFRFLSVNDTALREYGYSKDEFLSMTLRDLLPEEDLGTFDQYVQSMKGNRFTSICNHKLKDGQIIHVEISSHDINYFSREASLVLANDVTKTVKYEADLVKAKEKAEQSERLKTAFLANMSHEIRTPLNGIIGFAQLLNENQIDHDQVKLYSGYVLEGGNRLLELLCNIINVSKIESGVETVNLRDFIVNDILRDVYYQFVFRAKEKNIDYKLSLPVGSEEIKLVTDVVKLSQILTNFLSNALKFTSEGFIELGYRCSDSEIEFYVEDSGMGIDPGQQDLVFERFYQADNSISNGKDGAGLGLAICKGFSKLMNGEIRLDSVPGKGSVFYLTLPLNK